MKSKLKLPTVCMLILIIFFACNNAKDNGQKFELHGTLEGITDGEIFLMDMHSGVGSKDSALIKNGKFVFKGDYPAPTELRLLLSNSPTTILVENVKMNLTGLVREEKNILKLEDVKITGGKAHEDFARYFELRNALFKAGNDLRKEFQLSTTTEERKKELEQNLQKQEEERNALTEKFIKEYPTVYFSASLVAKKMSGKSAVETEKMIKNLDPALQKNPVIVKLLEKTLKLKDIEVGIDQMVANVSNVSYKVDEKFNGRELEDIIYLGVFSNNNICALKKDGTVQILDANGKQINSFKAELKGQASCLAVDSDNKIYLIRRINHEIRKKVRGRMKTHTVSSTECLVFDEKGVSKSQFLLKGIIYATGARVVDNNLIVADCFGGKLAMFDKTTGKVGSVMENMRSCCGILDFSVNKKKEILVANLGAFRVHGYDFSGKQLFAFGQKGRTLNDFHGCCNPVSVAGLSSGAIVTVEKDPTRIKIYSKEGAKQIAGIEELVEGCSYIPMIADSKDNLYLASKEKGIVKCISVN
ncbi:DUF4369 domain-containing protein [Ancylomarina sp. DW003]|nr:DUF4369 domain-containing protein [Ancylomarina sp. DW003]MDE5423892.1 DUF4369 domain-containing protein [Ancylomarina sp. DW003]